MPKNGATMKTCTKCHETKSEDAYHRDRTKRDGRTSRCRTCVADYCATNADKRRARSAVQYQATPNINWESTYRMRARKYGFEPVMKPFTRAELIARHGDACAHCGGPFEDLDHYPVPVALGGPHSLDNCVPSCIPCNRSTANEVRASRRAMATT